MLQVPTVSRGTPEENQEVETIYRNKNNYNDNIDDSKAELPSLPLPPPPTGQFFTLYNPIGLEAPAQRQRRRDRAQAIKNVNWKTYCRYFKVSRKSLIQTSLVAAVAPLLMTMGLTYICWGIEEMLHDFSSNDVLQISVFAAAGSFISSSFLLMLGIHLHQRFILFTCVMVLVVTFAIQIFTIAWIIIRSSRKKLHDFLQDLLSSYRVKENAVNSKTRLINKIQKEFSCCGISRHQDWFTSLPKKFNGTNLPKSCCCLHVPGEDKFRPSCYVTHNETDSTSWALSRKGCLDPLKKYLDAGDPKKWLYIGTGMVTLVLAGILTIIYISRTFKRISRHLKPEIRILIKKLVDDCTDKLFSQSEHFPSSPHLRDYVKDRVQQCKNVEEVTNLMCTLADTLYYMTYSRPADLAHFILQGKPQIISQFETDLRIIQQKEAANKKKSTKQNKKQVKDPPPVVVVGESQVPHNSLQDMDSSPSVPHVGPSKAANVPIQRGPSAIVVPYELKRRMKKVELFLIGCKEYENKLLPERHESQLQKESPGTLQLGRLRKFHQNDDDQTAVADGGGADEELQLSENLAMYRKQCFGASVIFKPLKVYRHSGAPLTAESDLMEERENFIHSATSSMSNLRHQLRRDQRKGSNDDVGVS